MQTLIQALNHPERAKRLLALQALVSQIKQGKIPAVTSGNDVNNHIHTIYSFSPYSPTNAVWQAYRAGLCTAGIMDHDSISGAREFIEAAQIMGMASTIGVECRANMASTALAGKRINNPDQISVAYVALHGIAHSQIDTVKAFFTPFSAARNVRNRAMTKRLNEILLPFDISLDFDKDIAPLSMCEEGGSITERHILFALSKKMGKGSKVVQLLTEGLKINLSSKVAALLEDENNPYYEYDLLGALKSDMVSQFYIDATDECPDIAQVVALAKQTGAILAYAYLGDVTNSVTGDKKTQKFEDDYLELLFDTLSHIGFHAVTYMPSRNTLEQLQRVMGLCDKHGLFQISGEDINTPRQSFICEAQRGQEFAHLQDATWALIGHEKAATGQLSEAMFSGATIEKYPNLKDRMNIYQKIGRSK